MFPKKRNTSSVFSDDFSVHQGLSHVTDWPLGLSSSRNHYIKPVPPYYVTEYEANYTWPPREALLGFQGSIHKDSGDKKAGREEQKEKGFDEEKSADKTHAGDAEYRELPPPSDPPGNENSASREIARPWLKMEEALSDLAMLERDSFLAFRVKREAHQHKLDDNIERAYKHYKRKLSILSKQPSHLGIHDELICKMQLFCDSVDAIKQAKVLAL